MRVRFSLPAHVLFLYTFMKPKILVILGPTASGKSALAVELAKKFNGEIISTDSRQVYTGLNIGTAKISKKEMGGVPHYLLDVESPKKVFTAHDFKIHAEKVIEDILARNKLPIIAGGTGFYIQTVVDNFILPEVPANKKLRKELEKKDLRELFNILARLDIRRAATVDVNNKVRLIRAIEIATHLGKVPEIKKEPKYVSLQIGLKIEDAELKKRIQARLLSRLKKGMLKEAQDLHQKGLSWKRMEELGLEYRYQALFLQKKITKQQMIDKINLESWHYAKRQMTWFKKDKRIKWFDAENINLTRTKIEKAVQKFISK